jgi:hypothetical protein
MTGPDPWKIHFQRLFMGALAGFVASVVKYWSQDHIKVVGFIERQQMDQFMTFSLGYCLGLAVLVFLGAISAWIVKEQDFRKMFWVGLSAPALLAAGIPTPSHIAPSPIVKQGVSDLSLISVARAQGSTKFDGPGECVGDTAFTKGWKTFWGIQPDRSDTFQVVAGSFTDVAAAQAKVRQLNADNPGLKARVGARACSSAYYPVFVSDPLPAEEARKALARAIRATGIEDAYLSPGPR